MNRTFNCKLDFIFLKSLCNVSKHVFAINIWLPCEKFYSEENFNRNVCRQQLCFYIFISVCSRGWFSLLLLLLLLLLLYSFTVLL